MSRLPIAVVSAVVALVVVVVLGAATGTSASRPVAPVISTAPVSSVTLVCPDLNGTPTGATTTAAAADLAAALTPPSQSEGTVTATVLAGPKSKTQALTLNPGAELHSKAKVDETVAVHASGSVAASLAADLVTETPVGPARGLASARCTAPATDWWFAGADGRVGFTDVLSLANPAPAAADVSISMWAAKGPLSTTRLEMIRVPARSAIHIGLASIAPDVATIAIHVHATSGTVSAALVDRRSSALLSYGGDFIPATLPPARSAVVAGFATGSGPRRLVLADPGPLAATVNLRLVTGSGSFVPAGINQVVVSAGHTRLISLEKPLAGGTGAVELTSDQPVLATGVSSSTAPPHRPDLMWLAATNPLNGSAGVATGRDPDGGPCLLLLSAPQGRAEVRVSTPSGKSTTISVPAGHSLAVNITATIREPASQAGAASWPFVVTSVGSAPVYGVRVLTFAGAHGALVTGEPLVALPAPIVLPAVREDPRVAVR